MTGWERWAKRLVKGFIWACFYVLFAVLLGITLTWQILLLVIGCSFIGDVLDGLIPTGDDAMPHPNQTEPT